MKILVSLLLSPVLGFLLLQCPQAKIGGTGTARNTANLTNTSGTPAATPGDQAPRITLEDAKKDFDENAALFVDTRPAPTYNSEHVKGAINLSAESFDAHYSELPKDKKIIAYCS